MKTIKSQPIGDQTVIVPGSKSYTHRILIAAALSDGLCTITNGLDSEDIRLTMNALQQMGAGFEETDAAILVHGTGGRLGPCTEPIYLGNSGTSMRLLTAVAALGQGTYTLTGNQRMCQRPIQELLEALKLLGVKVRAKKNNGCPPIEIIGQTIAGGRTTVNCATSSQFLSGLLLMAPHTQKGLDIIVSEGPISRPYIDMTVDVMARLGVAVERQGYASFSVAGKQIYRSGAYQVEPDCSQARTLPK